MLKQLSGLILCLNALSCQADVMVGRVVGVSDGDTIIVLSLEKKQTKLRLDSIDAPEKNQDFGQASKKYLSGLVFKKQISYEAVDTDKYGRTVAKVYSEGKLINLEMIKAGMAWVYVKYAKDQAYFDAEKAAKDSRLGLWDQPNPVPPWEFRHPENYPEHYPLLSSANDKCGTKRFCKQMTSCDEAKHYLNDCGVHKLDKDGDGVPCESLCKGS